MVNKHFCCRNMISNIYLLDQKAVLNNGEKSDKVIVYLSKFNEYGIPIGDNSSYIVIKYCPWCGKKLPVSRRKQWFNALQRLGYEAPLAKIITQTNTNHGVGGKIIMNRIT